MNNLLDTLAYNPPGTRRATSSGPRGPTTTPPFVFNTQDAHGPIRRGMFLVDCGSLVAVENLVTTLPQLEVLFELLNAPDEQRGV